MSNTSNQNNLDISRRFYGTDEYALFVYGKIEKFVTALYLVTDLLNKEEPLRHALRNQGICLISKFPGTGEGFSRVTQDRSILHDVETIASYLRIGGINGLFSQMNTEVLGREIEEIKHILKTKGEGLRIDQDLLEVSLPLPETSSLRDKDVRGQQQTTPSQKSSGRRPGEGLARNGTEGVSHRKSAILEYIRKQHTVSIRDIAIAVPGYSEKTLNRDLQDLIDNNLIVRTGERRWTRYSVRR